MQGHYDNNAGYQRPPLPVHRKEVAGMHDPEIFTKHLGDEEYYHDYLVFFQQEMEKRGWTNVVNEYLFSETELANDMLVRTFAGFLHPIIHLGFGIEFQQPAIVAEGLAQAAVHSNWIGKLFLPAEEASRKHLPSDGGKTLTELIYEIHDNKELRTAAHWSDGNKIRDGILARAPNAMLKYANQYVVRPEDDLEKKTAEMINASVLFTGTAQHPPKEVKFDFYFIHCVNASIFHSAFLTQDWLSDASKRRLLEWKGRVDLAMYASRRCPDILINEIMDYKPKDPQGDVVRRILEINDDGHSSKLIRALAHGREACAKYGTEVGEVQADMWDKLLHMAVDSVEKTNARWVRSAGFNEAWEDFQERPMANL
jgi:hypothetical protein